MIPSKKSFYLSITCMAFLFYLSSACANMQVIESPKETMGNFPNPASYRILVGESHTCQTARSLKRWKILFASYPLSVPDSREIFSDPQKTYRIRESADWGDITLSILLGLTTSITRDTILVEECAESSQFLSDLAKEIPESNPLFQEKLAESIRKEKERLKILDIEVTDETLPDSQLEAKSETSGANSEEVQTNIWLKNGNRIQGKLESQDVDRVIILDSSGNQKEILKTDIHKIQFR
jgi:sRNA-binding regulator protein Hfq